MIRGVTFDWWHTIAETPWPDYDARMRTARVEQIASALSAHRPRIEPEVLFRSYDRHTRLLEDHWHRNRDLRPDEQIDAFLGFAGLDRSDARLREPIAKAFGEAIRAEPPVIDPHIQETLEILRAAGYRIGLVSNTGRTWGRFLRPIQDAMGIGRHFDARVFSDEVGVRKPEPRIFDVALAAMGLRPEEAVHVGDDVVADVAGSKGIGMRAVWFNNGVAAEHAVHVWPASIDARPDAEIRDCRDLPGILEAWR